MIWSNCTTTHPSLLLLSNGKCSLQQNSIAKHQKTCGHVWLPEWVCGRMCSHALLTLHWIPPILKILLLMLLHQWNWGGLIGKGKKGTRENQWEWQKIQMLNRKGLHNQWHLLHHRHEMWFRATCGFHFFTHEMQFRSDVKPCCNCTCVSSHGYYLLPFKFLHWVVPMPLLLKQGLSTTTSPSWWSMRISSEDNHDPFSLSAAHWFIIH